ncbi:class I SAM-dependent methyltransferase [Nonomuraea dietziae]|uniref:class I SAM-dependent methyltransferase n=1 Tax=Nonomuraea dietziae TaxID=65515 RepID=UPI003324C6CF
MACGIGIVTALLRRLGRWIVGVDSSPGMARVAASRLEASVVIGDARRCAPGRAGGARRPAGRAARAGSPASRPRLR